MEPTQSATLSPTKSRTREIPSAVISAAMIFILRSAEELGTCFQVSLLLFIPLWAMTVFTIVHYVHHLQKGTPVSHPGNVTLWRHIIARHIYAGVFYPCHSRCWYIHALLLTCHVTVLLFWLTLLWLLWAPSSQLLRGAIVYLVPIISQPVVPVLSALSFTWWLVQVDPRHELFAEVRELYPNDFPSAAEHVRLSVCVPELSFDELTVLVPEKAKIKYLERDPEAAVIEEQTSILQSERGSVWHQAEAELAPYHYGWGSQQAPLPPADESAESIALHAFFLPDKAVDEDVGRAYLSRNQ